MGLELGPMTEAEVGVGKKAGLLECSFFTSSRSEYFRNFVDSCLQKIPQDRPTSDVLLKVLLSSAAPLNRGLLSPLAIVHLCL